jgi:hypothetical protein
MNSKIFTPMRDMLMVEEYDRWEDPGGHDGGTMPSGPWYPSSVAGFVIAKVEDEYWTFGLDANEPDTLHDLAGEINLPSNTNEDDDGVISCKKFTHFKLAPTIYLFIPDEMEYNDCEVSVNNPSNEKILEQAKAWLASHEMA